MRQYDCKSLPDLPYSCSAQLKRFPLSLQSTTDEVGSRSFFESLTRADTKQFCPKVINRISLTHPHTI
jgi:hypothetical protein